MNIKQFLLNLFCPIKSTYFKLKIKRVWYSNRYFVIAYSTNYGITWHNLKEISRWTDTYTKRYFFEDVTWARIPHHHDLEKIDSYEKIHIRNTELKSKLTARNKSLSSSEKSRLKDQSIKIKNFNR